METHRLAVLGFLLQAAMHVGFVVVNLAMFSQPGYAFAAGLLALAALLSAVAVRHGWDDHAALLAWATAAAAAVTALRWAVAEIGRPLDLTSPLALILPIGQAAVAAGTWSLWRGVRDFGNVRALLRVVVGSAILAIAVFGFAAVALTAGGIPIGSTLLVGGPGFALVGWAAWRAMRDAKEKAEPASPPPAAPKTPLKAPAKGRARKALRSAMDK